MNSDLENTLDELGPEYRALVTRLRGAFECKAMNGAASAAITPGRVGRFRWRPALLTAASLLIGLALGFAVYANREKASERVYTVRATDAAYEYRLALMRNDEAVKELIRTQNADGSWKNAFLTRQNAEALRHSNSAEARVAYKRAMRNLRAHGINSL